MTEPARGPSRLRLLLPRHRGDRGDRRASLLAFVLQVGIIAVIVPSFVVPIAFDLLRDDRGRAVTPERISFITAVPRGEGSPDEAPRDGGDGRVPAERPTDAEPLAPIVAPSEVPTGIAPAPSTPREDPGGVGPLVGGGGPTRGVRPSFTDRRLWLPESEIILAPTGPQTRADSLKWMLAERIVDYTDSVSRANPQGRAPGDWTFERNGKKYGIDPRYIRLGDFEIPTALLALMPMNVQANPIAMERNRRLNAMTSEIQYQAARMARDDEFRQAVRALRERKERERREAEAQRIPEEPRRP